MRTITCLIGAALIFANCESNAAATSSTGIDARMLRYPDVSSTQIAFVYAGDIWVAPKAGGEAERLSSPKGEESFPRFSPDGSQIAFTGDYDGNMDVYVMPVSGGLPKRLTYHGAPDRMLEWYPDGKSILFASPRASEKDRFNQLYKMSANGGLPEKLPVPYGEFGSISPDGRMLAYVPISTDFRTWKRYRGGMNPAIWLFDLQTYSATNITGNDAANSIPMWHGATLYFLSDRDKNQRANIWAYDTKKGTTRQITAFEDFDVHFPNIGPEEIVFENGGRLYLLNLATEKHTEVKIEVRTDRATLKPRLEDVSKDLFDVGISPNAKRVVVESRGDIFSVPAEHGVVRNLTSSSGVAERYPAWSPDGKTIAYFSDRSGEYELTIRPADGSGEEQTLTHLGPGFRYNLWWSPDSKKLVFIDQTMRIHLHDLEKKQTSIIGRELWQFEGGLAGFRAAWSKDSRWVAYSHDLENRNSAIALYDTKEGKEQVVTSGYYDDDEPVWDPDGKYLFYRSGRDFDPVYSDLDSTWIYPNTTEIMAVSLRNDVPSLTAPRNDDEGDKDTKEHEKDSDKDKDKDKKKDDSKKDAGESAGKSDKASGDDAASKKDKSPGDKDESKDEKPPKPVEIDLAGFRAKSRIPAAQGRPR
jgi:tricorn protease